MTTSLGTDWDGVGINSKVESAPEVGVSVIADNGAAAGTPMGLGIRYVFEAVDPIVGLVLVMMCGKSAPISKNVCQGAIFPVAGSPIPGSVTV